MKITSKFHSDNNIESRVNSLIGEYGIEPRLLKNTQEDKAVII